MRFDPVVEIVRLEESPEGTFGALRVNKQVLCLTLEPPDRENEQNVSSVPAQQYACVRTVSPRFGETFAIQGVPGRSGVLFHSGNTVDDTSGCILLGERYAPPGQRRGVQDSKRAFSAFMDVMRGREGFHLTVHEHF